MLNKISNHKLRVLIILALLTTISGCRELSESLEPGEDKNLKAVNREKPNLADESGKINVNPDADNLTEEKTAPVEKQKSNAATNSNISTNANTSTNVNQIKKEDTAKETTFDEGCSEKPSDTEIYVYAEANFKGDCVKLGKIGYQLPNMDNFGIPNDSISSIKVGNKVRAVVCEHNDFEGVCQALLNDESSLENSDIGNDNISSIKILGKN